MNKSKKKPNETGTETKNEDSEPVLTVFDDHEVPYSVLNDALTRLVKIVEKPLVGKETFPPVKLKKDQVEFMVQTHYSWCICCDQDGCYCIFHYYFYLPF